MYLSELYGAKIIASPIFKTSKQARTHKKRRINKKWLKRYGYRIVDDMKTIYVMNDMFYMSEGLFNKLKKNVEFYNKFKEGIDELQLDTIS